MIQMKTIISAVLEEDQMAETEETGMAETEATEMAETTIIHVIRTHTIMWLLGCKLWLINKKTVKKIGKQKSKQLMTNSQMQRNYRQNYKKKL